jgi:hypothetical protein
MYTPGVQSVQPNIYSIFSSNHSQVHIEVALDRQLGAPILSLTRSSVSFFLFFVLLELPQVLSSILE